MTLISVRYWRSPYKRVPGIGSGYAVGYRMHEVENSRLRLQSSCQTGSGLEARLEGTRLAFQLAEDNQVTGTCGRGIGQGQLVFGMGRD